MVEISNDDTHHQVDAPMPNLPDALEHLLAQNKAWASTRTHPQPADVSSMHSSSVADSPSFLWIGCSDSRVPPNEIVNMGTGSLAVHRNIANVISYTDLNLLSTVGYAIETQHVTDIILCGHYGCGGVKAALGATSHGLIDNWLLQVKQVHSAYRNMIDQVKEDEGKVEVLVELNVVCGVRALTQLPAVQDAWRRGQELRIHGWVFELGRGALTDLECTVESIEGATALNALQPMLTPHVSSSTAMARRLHRSGTITSMSSQPGQLLPSPPMSPPEHSSGNWASRRWLFGGRPLGKNHSNRKNGVANADSMNDDDEHISCFPMLVWKSK
ncbi:hypothetical protein BSLG_002031 [Batrachochytrium salamandrivorans]|nr:hypothetical protein BASA83_007745 [Batrachochytrium salamandrivorans]KAJ1343442.1 hypothetical protein BSLG_002031 [Batrachochytrium salamandrivorans]